MRHPSSDKFAQNARAAIDDAELQQSLRAIGRGFIDKRQAAIDNLPEFEQLRDEAQAIKQHVLDNLDVYLQQFQTNVIKQGGYVHWAETAEQARTIIGDLCRQQKARTITKGKSMVTEEIALNAYLEQQGYRVIETDLGEYIIQLRNEAPSHIIAPALHLRQQQIAETFREHHRHLDQDRDLQSAPALVREARLMLREQYLSADIGITGANFLLAETGSTVIVTNEGNGDMTQIFPNTHIVVATIEKIVPNLEDLATLLRVLGRSATGQEMSAYTTISTGARRHDDADGPAQYHVVIVDNGRSDLLASDNRDVLRCIRCGACMNHCPVYQAIGGHAYGWVYPGPIGAVLTPGLLGLHEGKDLPNASSFCGRCEEVCPVRIPLPQLMRNFRQEQFAQGAISPTQRYGLRLWRALACHPARYHRLLRIAAAALRLVYGRAGMVRSVPLAHHWARHRDVAIPRGKPFMQQWQETQQR